MPQVNGNVEYLDWCLRLICDFGQFEHGGPIILCGCGKAPDYGGQCNRSEGGNSHRIFGRRANNPAMGAELAGSGRAKYRHHQLG